MNDGLELTFIPGTHYLQRTFEIDITVDEFEPRKDGFVGEFTKVFQQFFAVSANLPSARILGGQGLHPTVNFKFRLQNEKSIETRSAQNTYLDASDGRQTPTLRAPSYLLLHHRVWDPFEVFVGDVGLEGDRDEARALPLVEVEGEDQPCEMVDTEKARCEIVLHRFWETLSRYWTFRRGKSLLKKDQLADIEFYRDGKTIQGKLL